MQITQNEGVSWRKLLNVDCEAAWNTRDHHSAWVGQRKVDRLLQRQLLTVNLVPASDNVRRIARTACPKERRKLCGCAARNLLANLGMKSKKWLKRFVISARRFSLGRNSA